MVGPRRCGGRVSEASSPVRAGRQGCGRAQSVPLVQLLAVKMRRHGRTPGVELTVEVSEFAPRILEEESTPEGEQGGGHVEKEHAGKEQDTGAAAVKEQGPVGNEKPQLSHQEEEEAQDEDSGCKYGVSDHGRASLVKAWSSRK